ncbi:unnamed protein product [Paramecium primaurelia]|uniref:Uncharacterized protein n=1 Tax=Paramecium primaurelia TaxID=5886 RepID=A0A8S1NX16_PARPR|nr:unnamed protein product [Paramecium primaurelia]
MNQTLMLLGKSPSKQKEEKKQFEGQGIAPVSKVLSQLFLTFYPVYLSTQKKASLKWRRPHVKE